jgi:hypothetical protein
MVFGLLNAGEGGVFEQVDALVVLAFGAPQALGGAVGVEGVDPEGVGEPLSHLGGAQLGDGDQHLGGQLEAAGVLLVGQPHGHRGVGVQVGGLEVIERLDQLREGQGDRQAQDAMQAHGQGGGGLAADVGRGRRRQARPPAAAAGWAAAPPSGWCAGPGW